MWSACVGFPSRSSRDLLDCISNAWANTFGNMKVFALDGEIGMRPNDLDDLQMCNQVALKLKAPHQKAWLVERHKAFIRSALQRAESQVLKEALCISLATVLGLVQFMHGALVLIKHRTPHQALLGRQAPFARTP